MIRRLSGTIIESSQNPIVVDVHGVGYAVHVASEHMKKIKINDTKTFFIHTHVRDDALDLYGFDSKHELSFFELLLTVSGIGPRTALSITDRGASSIERAVQTSDVDFFTTIPRLGKKNAQKIIIELKNKLGSLIDLDLTSDTGGETKQIVEALTDMGFARNEVIEAMKKLEVNEATLEQKMRHMLKLLAKTQP